MKRTGKRTYSSACFLNYTEDIFEDEDIIQEMAEHSEYNRECEGGVSLHKEKGNVIFILITPGTV